MNKKISASILLPLLFSAFVPALSLAACSQVSGKAYYTDSVSFFSDSACRQEIIASGSNAPASSLTGYISTGNANCRYSLSKKQYTDGVSFFTDNKCAAEALNGEAVPAPTAAAAQAPAMAQTSAITSTPLSAGVLTQTDQRIAALEKKVDILMAIISQILILLAKK